MRFLLGLILTCGFLLSGGAVMVAFFEVYASEGMSEDAGAALFIGGMLLFIGILMLFAVFKSRRRRQRFDAEQATAKGMAHWMAMDHSGDSGDFDGGGDGGGGD
ncbi:MAG: hypothetical protein JJ866_02180 [Roseibium sp.]|uniref:hypothetical protein n=1 Tax=Roseibium sp. TaxID=1936156 RepID=UPI001B22E1CE|nr:hypothetical protein [Roseibium sp.]MBO6890725.1 hypothetical protein [Roseibium sp.]MBO6930984.1 hypothetical protein [Roseibium sp.]